jgi:hypothetical protein
MAIFWNIPHSSVDKEARMSVLQGELDLPWKEASCRAVRTSSQQDNTGKGGQGPGLQEVHAGAPEEEGEGKRCSRCDRKQGIAPLVLCLAGVQAPG